MKLLKKAKTLIIRFTICTLMLTAAVPNITSFADAASDIEDNTTALISEIKSEKKYKQTKPNEDKEDEDSAKLRDALADELATAIEPIDASYNANITVGTGQEIIKQVCKNAKVESAFQNAWINAFTESALQLGIPASTMGQKIQKKMIDAKQGQFISDDASIEYAAAKVKKLKWDGSSGIMSELMKSLDDDLSTFSEYLIALGYAMCISFSCLTLTEQVADRKFSTESFSMTILKMCIGLWVIYNSRGCVGILVSWGGVLIDKFTISLTESDMRYALYKNALASSLASTVIKLNPISETAGSMMTNLSNFWDQAALVAVGAASYLTAVANMSLVGEVLMYFMGGGIIQLVSSFTIYSIIIEIMVRGIFVPIAIADLYNDILRSAATKYLKKIFALCLTGVVIYMIIYASTKLKSNMGMDAIARIAINISMLGMMARARSIAEDIVGAH